MIAAERRKESITDFIESIHRAHGPLDLSLSPVSVAELVHGVFLPAVPSSNVLHQVVVLASLDLRPRRSPKRTPRRALAINHQPVTLDQLEARLRTIYAGRRNKTLFVSGAPSLRYKAIIGALDAAKGAGIDRVGIITDAMRRK